MNKSPEEYFTEQDLSTSQKESNFSPAEKAFLDKYVGADNKDFLDKLGVESDSEEATSDENPEMSSDESIDQLIRKAEKLQMVAFYLGSQEFIVPTMVVQEVVRVMPVAKLPAAPQIVSGVVSLRGKVTPIILLREVLEANSPRQTEDRFIIVCRRHGLQFGLTIERVHTMYQVDQKNIDWGIENHFGSNVEYIAGLVKLNDELVSIIDIDKIITGILN